ncbi:autotransporter-associated beta strand protein [Streptomyces sp. 1114.5]|uniref:phosphatase PAP2 family protein n=1 Tax=Streptomyces sp. 1114.5 TaxID=1938830 RepID=UPI000EB2F713|nr:phosphatase PAP2 family protein [Streptomyces sp. 1114.5]RKT19874.1 autotransporter-associated beta strand protein [Streptomyces sp. 1114.5]
MYEQPTLNRRRFLRSSAATSVGLLTAPTAVSLLAAPQRAAAAPVGPVPGAAFVDSYATNTMADLTPEGNAAVRILTGMNRIWHTGTSWNDGSPLMADVLRANVRYCVEITTERTADQAKEAFIYDRQHQGYAVIAGLGPLADLYRTGARAVTSITTAPDSTPPAKIDDAVPAGAPAGSAIGPGAVDSELGQVVTLVNTLRGPYASGNPAKYAYRYPRPWRMNEDSAVVDTGATDALGYPVYASDVVVAPQLLRQRSNSPADDGGFVSGHTNAFHLSALALAYAVPERFQELIARAFELSHTRIMSGMHSPLDVIGGRTLATALAAATLADPRNATLKAAARSQAAAYFRSKTGSTADTLYAYAHRATSAEDPYADREANAEQVTPKLTYVLRRSGRDVPMTVPKGAEVLLETRLPYLDAAQRREVLRTTALPSGYVLLDGPEMWGRLNLFAAADGYGAFERDVTVELNAADGGFCAADAWQNDIAGPGGLTKRGTGTLTLTGTNRYTGATVVAGGVLVAGSRDALGRGSVQVRGGTLRVDAERGAVRVHGDLLQAAGTGLELTLYHCHSPALTVAGRVTLGRGTQLLLQLPDTLDPDEDVVLPLLNGRTLQGEFGSITVDADGYEVRPLYSHDGLAVRLTRC